MNFDFLKNITQLSALYHDLTSDNIETPYIRCINYGKDIELLVRYVYRIALSSIKIEGSVMIKLIKDKEFKQFLGRTEYYDKIHFIYLAGNNAAFDHNIDIETADLSLECLKEITCIIFNKINSINFSDYEDKKVEEYIYIPSKAKDISEAKTRELYIDANLVNAGYKINKYKDNLGHGRPSANQVCVEIEVHNLPNQKVGYIDYVIYNKACLPIAVIEAKRTSRSPEDGAQQARDYADALKKELNLGYRPIIYYTNGFEIKIQDRLGYPARSVSNFASMSDLELMIKRQLPGDIDTRKPIFDKTVDTNIINRSKLIESVQSLIESFDVKGDFRRKSLLVLPCGVGKTRTAVALSKILLKNDWAQNILFLADRNNLVSNALKPFREYIDGVVSDISAENPDRDINARVCICTYQSMMSFINKPKKDFSVGHFDLIIVDEAHRSIFNIYKSIFEYFDAFLVGLTATPSKAIDRSTYDIFNLDVDKPTFEVKFEEAVNLDYLVSYKAFDKSSKILTNGVKYNDLTDEQKDKLEDLGFGDCDIPADVFKGTVSSTGSLLNTDTIKKMFDDLFLYGLKVDHGNKIGKTLIFARDHNHAQKIVDCFKDKYGKFGDDFCQLVDSSVEKNKTIQDNFACKTKNPQIVVSVNMMDTGVDIVEIVNLVFFKPVLSKIKFDQMWGRGTRTCKDLYVLSPSREYFEGKSSDNSLKIHKDKQGFFVFDYCGNFEYFDDPTAGSEPAFSPNINQKIFYTHLCLLKKLEHGDYQIQPDYKEYYENLKNVLIQKVTDLDTSRVDVHNELAYVEKYKAKSSFDHLSDTKIYEIKTHLLRFIDNVSLDESLSKSWMYKILIIQLSLIDDAIDSTKQQVEIMKIAEKLLEKASIPEIYSKINILKAISNEEYYDNLEFFKLENLIKEVGSLIKFLKEDHKIYDICIDDEIITKERDPNIDFDDFRTYREKFINYLQKNYKNMKSVNKILSLDCLNQGDLDELNNILISLKKDGDDNLFTTDEELIIFIRRIIGLNRSLIDSKCSEFLNKNNFNKDQRNLLNLIIDFAIRNGNISNDDLVNSEPFSNIEIPELFSNIDPVLNIVNLFNNSLVIRQFHNYN